jgi:2-methylisocitrate lyase-like PEP mutase family enzyme
MTNLDKRHETFRDLHADGCFVIPNPWDIGSAKVMESLGAKALATTSSGFAFTLGRPDMGNVTRDEALAHAQTLVESVSVPVSGDFENGFADDPDGVAETIRLAAEVGLSGCSIEDTMMVDGNPAYDFDLAVERVRAAASAVRALEQPFVFCARADGVMNGVYDTDEAIRRIQAFDAAGADLLYVPLPPDFDALKRIVESVEKPINALAAGRFAGYAQRDFAEIGVRRISVGGAMARVTHQALVESASAALSDGDFTPLQQAANGQKIDAMLAGKYDG